MKNTEVKNLDHGLYKIHWKPSSGGGTSLAAVGSTESGQRWLAPTNWLAPSTAAKDWRAVEKVTRVR